MFSDLEIIFSPLSGDFTCDGITVLVEIYRLSDRDRWSLEVVYQQTSCTLWTHEFPTDQAAFSSFLRVAEIEGLSRFKTEAKFTLH